MVPSYRRGVYWQHDKTLFSCSWMIHPHYQFNATMMLLNEKTFFPHETKCHLTKAAPQLRTANRRYTV